MKCGIYPILTLFVLVLYIAGTSHLEFLHSFVHDHDIAVTHSEEQEKDPCHRLLYHEDIEQGCGHDSHLIITDTCQMCDLACHGDQTLLPDADFSVGEFLSSHFDVSKEGRYSYSAVISSSRAPPALA